MDIKSKRVVKGGQGSAAAGAHLDWYIKAGSWQYGAEASEESIQAEKDENDKRFGVPCADRLKDPAGSGFDADATLKNPHNFSNNPGFMSTSTGDMATMGNPSSGGSDLRMAMRGGEGTTTSGPSARVGRSLPRSPFAGFRGYRF